MTRSTITCGQRLVAPGIDRPLFGQVARQISALTSRQLNDCLREQAVSGRRLGSIMRERQLLTDEQVLEVLRFQARWIARSNRADYLAEDGRYPAFLSLCLPAYNEQDVIIETLESACTILEELFTRFEVIVVNDGSSDATGQLVAEFARRDPRARLLEHDENRGYGAAVATGLQAAEGELIAFSDSDGQFSFLEFPQLLRELEGCDLVVGYRYHRVEPWPRKLNAWAWGRLVRFLLGVQVRDLDCAFKVFRREVLQGVEMTATGACINAEIMSQCVHGGCEFHEVPVSHFPRTAGAATGANLKVIARAFRELPSLWKYRKLSKLRRLHPAATVQQPTA